MTPAPTVQYGLSYGAYCDLDAVNVSKLLTYSGQSPAEALYEQQHDKGETPSLVKGHASHAAVLTPDIFEKDYAAPPPFGDMRSPKARQERDAWYDAHPNVIPLDLKERECAVNVRNSLMKDPFISTLFNGKGSSEVTLTWTDEATGLPCKARIDRLAYYRGFPALIDLKTARDIDDASIQKAIVAYKYHVRMAFYYDALQLKAPQDFRVLLAWCLNRAPYLGRVTELEDSDLEEGRQEYRRLMKIHAKCVSENKWPGYGDAPEPLGLPVWAFRHHHSSE